MVRTVGLFTLYIMLVTVGQYAVWFSQYISLLAHSRSQFLESVIFPYEMVVTGGQYAVWFSQLISTVWVTDFRVCYIFV